MINTLFDNYDRKINYISKHGEKDEMGYVKEVRIEKYVRYIGGKEVQIPTNNGYRTEHRLLFQCPFKVEDGDKFEIDDKKLQVKQTEEVTDVLGETIYWECELL